MRNLREYASTAAFNADRTREYPTVSHIVGGDVRYEERQQLPTITLVETLSGNGGVVKVTYDSEVITAWPDITIDNTSLPTFNFTYNSNTQKYGYVNGNDEYYLSIDGGYVKSTHITIANGNGIEASQKFNPDGTAHMNENEMGGGIR